jgi:hypothetical protein
VSEVSPLPWSYRPLKHDDWGYVRGANGEIACTARKGFYLSEDEAHRHRVNKTDPYGPNAALIIKAVNAHGELIEALRSIWNYSNDPAVVEMARKAIAKHSLLVPSDDVSTPTTGATNEP